MKVITLAVMEHMHYTQINKIKNINQKSKKIDS